MHTMIDQPKGMNSALPAALTPSGMVKAVPAPSVVMSSGY